MRKWFNDQSRLVQCLLLLVPFVNWIVEILVRGDKMIHKPGLISIIMFVLALFTFGILGWVDLVWCLLFKHLILGK